MHTEIEATFLDVDHDSLRAHLQKLGGVCKEPDHNMLRTAYDFPDLRLDKRAAWVRVRQEGERVTMAFKQRQSEDITGMKEVELVVDSYQEGCSFLEAVGMVPKAVQETKREVWQLGVCEVMLDTWPWIPPYIEIEGPSEQAVRNVGEQLGFDYGAAIFDSADAVYQKYFDVTQREISTVPLIFGPVPDWLEKRRRI